ncbi:hypothetical protein MTO96_047902 [Rhipicephalus appendiculatus]
MQSQVPPEPRIDKGGDDDVPPSIERSKRPYARDNEEVPMWARLDERSASKAKGNPPGRGEGETRAARRERGAKTRPQQRFTMRTTILAVTVFVAIAAVSASRSARQTHYQPSGGASASRGPAGYDAYQPQQAQAQSFRPQVQAAPQQSYDQSAFQGQPAPRGRTTVQSFGGGPSRPTQQSQQGGQQSQSEEEEEEKPNPLTLLLEKSTFTCSSKTDGYYADNSVNCQVFHYCVGGAKHSWMCPEGTVFHQVHLNCVPASQDICNTAEKFFFVNDYLHKASAPAHDQPGSFL